MGNHQAQEVQAAAVPPTTDHQATVWLKRGRPDPFRAPGVPDRLVIVLHREGLQYVGKMTMWEYREIEVRNGKEADGTPHYEVEMVVDASMPHQVDMLVQMHQRPTAARLVAELVDVLRTMVGPLAGHRPAVPPQHRRRIHLNP